MDTPNTKRMTLPMAAEELLRHRPPMLLIDRLLTRDGGRATAAAGISSTGIFCTGDNLVLPEYFIEVIAQTMAAANGYDALRENSSPKAGFIVGIDTFSLHHRPSPPADFLIEVATSMEFATMKVMTGKVLQGSTPIASAEIKVWEQPNGG